MSVLEMSGAGYRMLVGGYLWTGACGAVPVGGCGRQMYVGCWEELGKDRIGCPISEGIFASFSVFKFQREATAGAGVRETC